MKWRWITGLLIGWLLAGGAVGASDDYTDRMLFADGLYSRQMYDLALKEYAALLKSFPAGASNDAATFRLAECLRLKGDVASAARFYSHVVVNFRASPFRLRAAYRRARLYADDGEPESAIAHYRVILQENPPADLASAAQYYLGEGLLAKGDVTDADAAFAEIGLRYDTSGFSAFALMKRAGIRRDRWMTLKEEGDPSAAAVIAQALAFYEQSLVKPGAEQVAAEALFQSAGIYFSQRDFQKSAALYRQLLTQYPDDKRSAQALLQAAWSAVNAGLYAEALTAAAQGLADPDRAAMHDEWLYLKANSERQLLQYERSMQTYRELLERFPASRFSDPVRYEMAVSHYKAGAYDLAVSEAERIRLTPALRADVCWLLAESYAALNRSAEATQYYRMVVRENPGADRARDAMYRLAHQLQKQSSYREASRFYLELVASYPEDVLAAQALFASAFCLAQAGAHEESVRDWRRLVQEYPAHELAEDGLYQKAMGEVRLGRRTDAASSLDELRRRFPKSRFLADAWYWQGMMYYEQDRYAAAEQALREARRLALREELRRESTFQLGLVLQKLNKPDDSAALLQELVSSPLSGRFPPALLEWLAAWHGDRADYTRMGEAALLLTQAADPAWVQVGWVLSGRAHRSASRVDEAAVAFRAALATGAVTHYAAEAALQLGSMALDRGEEEAERYFREASARAVGEGASAVRARAFMGLGQVAERTGGNEDASRYFLSVAILYDDAVLVPECLYRAAQAFDRLGRQDDRAKTVQELVERYPESEWTEKARKTWPI